MWKERQQKDQKNNLYQCLWTTGSFFDLVPVYLALVHCAIFITLPIVISIYVKEGGKLY